MTNRPWKPRPRLESRLHSQVIVRLMKFGCSGPMLSIAFPNEFGKVLNDCRSVNFDRLPNCGTIRHLFASLAERMGYSPDGGPFDWTPCYPQTSILILDEPEISISDEGKDNGDDHSGEDSYYGMDLDSWQPHGEQDKDVTLPAQQEATARWHYAAGCRSGRQLNHLGHCRSLGSY